MIAGILCEARRRKRSIQKVCEYFGDRSIRAKFTNQICLVREPAIRLRLKILIIWLALEIESNFCTLFTTGDKVGNC